jgi:flagellar assembly protein FliH
VAQARQSGFDAGVQKGREENAAVAKDASDRLAQTLSELAWLKRKIRNEAEGEVLKLALAIAKRILYRELATDPEAIQGIIHSALQNLQNRDISQVRVYPNGADAVRNSLERAGAPAAVRVIPDSTLKEGDVIFETSLGDLDVSIETQIQEIQRGFADRLRSR